MLTLWDLLKPAPARPRKGGRPRKRGRLGKGGQRAGKNRARGVGLGERSRRPIQDRYDAMARDLLGLHEIRVRKWRSSMSGVAWEVHYHNGNVSRLIEAPQPRGPMSAAIFLHEIGHHVIGFGVHRPRCLEEYHAWVWALAEMERRGFNVTDNVRRRMHESLAYAVGKARRRGLKRLPAELEPYARYPEPRARHSR